MTTVVDTNIIFSALLNSDGLIGDLLFNSHGIFDFYSCNYMRKEIEKHWDRLKRLSKLKHANLEESKLRVYSRINFINEELIPASIWIEAEKLVSDIDKDDLDFIAIARFLNGSLWSGDKLLYQGLKQKNFTWPFNNSELLSLRLSIS